MSGKPAAPDGSPVALVTGAGSGIGRATATELAKRGYAIALLDLDNESLDAASSALNDSGASCHSMQADVTDDRAVADAVVSIVDLWGGVDAVAACAGVEVLGDVLSLSASEWRRALDVNLTGVFNVAKATMVHLIARSGAFVAVASDAGVAGAQGYSAYAASKHGVVGLIRCMALDFGPSGVRSNVVCPAFTETPMADRIFENSPAGDPNFYRSVVPLGRFAQPVEIALAIAHLLSEDASYTNGLVYCIDGGSTAGYFRPPESEG